MTTDPRDLVGPVFQASALGEALAGALRELNAGVTFVDRGAYVRVLSPGRCVLTRSVLERHAGRSVSFPGEVTALMSSFKGHLRLSEEAMSWEFGAEERRGG